MVIGDRWKNEKRETHLGGQLRIDSLYTKHFLLLPSSTPVSCGTRPPRQERDPLAKTGPPRQELDPLARNATPSPGLDPLARNWTPSPGTGPPRQELDPLARNWTPSPGTRPPRPEHDPVTDVSCRQLTPMKASKSVGGKQRVGISR
ncbi:hypothetical protein Pmani_037869 [Petrolisthes manimaculis]|uniref:Uncharacterized protein n=1 Tax=Petrolisthes manimaculis TaxID=1843537 RepID=A0AAE1NGV2_9EUCA|nr:hypothetical protein Pmani_037869 [Petrolisthes manimaculis]